MHKPDTTAVCPRCGKQKNPNPTSGDLAGYLLQSNYCNCDEIKARAAQSGLKPLTRLEDDADICPKCGLQLATSLPGSMTGFLFQDVRCKCKPDSAFAEGSMSGKFFNLKATDPGRTFYAGTNPSGGKTTAGLSINLAPGAVIGGIYKIRKLIGSGGMGEVYEAEHTSLGKVCALKVVPPQKVTEVGWLRFQQEAKTVAALNHLNLVQVSDLGIHEGCLPFYAMELVPGRNLAEMLASHGAIPYKAALEIFKQVCDGVDHAHRAGIIHRDLKPGNIMVAKEGNHWQVKILDFGLAKLTKHTRDKQGLTSVGEIFGSPYYMSPEQCTGGKQDNRSDIYSLGCTLFECLSGKPPFAGNNASEIVAGHEHYDAPSVQTVAATTGSTTKFPADLEIIMAKLLRKNPVERYQTCSELKSDLERLERGEAVKPYYMSRTHTLEHKMPELPAVELSPQRQAVARPLLVAGVAIALIATIGGATGIYLVNQRAERATKVKVATSPDLLSEALNFQDVKLSKQEQQSLVPAAPTKPPPSCNQTKPYSSLLTEGGEDYRVYDFPDDITIGTIKENTTPEYPARGRVKIPVGALTTFSPFPAVTLSSNYFSRFRDGDFNQILIKDAGDTNKIIAALPNFAAYKKLTFISVSVSSVNDSLVEHDPVKLDDKSIAILSKLEHPLDLYTVSSIVSIEQLLELPWLNGLIAMRLDHYPDLAPIMHKLRGNQTISKIGMDNSDMPLGGWLDIATFKSVAAIDGGIGANTIPRLKAIAAMPELTALYGGNLALNESTFRILRQIKKLKLLRLRTREQYDDLTMARARAALPGVAFSFVRGSAYGKELF